MNDAQAMNPITEDDIANYLANTPDFFERHAELLASVQLTSPHGQRAVSLQERQAEMLREKIRTLEHRIMDMVRHGNENLLIADKLYRWARSLFLVAQAGDRPERIQASLREQFEVPQVSLKLWGLAPAYAGRDYAQGVSEDAQVLAASLSTPYCGANAGFQATQWLDDPAAAQSLALIALRAGEGEGGPVFGLLVLASPDPERFQGAMGTDFLQRLAELAGAALQGLRD